MQAAHTAPHGEPPNTSVFSWTAPITPWGELGIPAPDLNCSLDETRKGIERFYEERQTSRRNRRPITPEAAAAFIASKVDHDMDPFLAGEAVAGFAATEERAFGIYLLISHLNPMEGYRRWRRGFPIPMDAEDPLLSLLDTFKIPPDAG